MKIYSILSVIFSTSISEIISCVFVHLPDGVIKGHMLHTPGSDGHTKFYAFQEIPYAAPPIGPLRFKPPQPISSWDGILHATKNTKICYQVGANSDMETEDCLYLNVYTPQLPANDNVSLPVMVYIHGGGFITGDATYPSFGPEFLMDYGVVIVTLNYRLGPFGFLTTDDGVIPGNNGLKDQLFALQWVHRNIHLFGGDANKVTIFGQSAGAASVGYHLVSEKSRGLYRGAILQSGTALSPFGYQRNAQFYAFKTGFYLDSTISENSTSEELLEVLMEASAKEIDEASTKINAEETFNNIQILQGYYYAPVIEAQSEDAFLTWKMFEIIKSGNADKVPIIIGINSEEMIGPNTDLDLLKKIFTAFDAYLEPFVPDDMNIKDVQLKKEVGKIIRNIYTGGDLMQNHLGDSIRFMSDTGFNRASITHASLQSQFSDVYFYQFSYDGLMGNVSVTVKGAEHVGHNEELPYIWRISNDLFYNYDLTIFPKSDIITHHRLLTMWTNFAKTLNPTPEKSELLENVIWPRFLSRNNFSYLNIGDNLEIKQHPKEDTYNLWLQIYEHFGNSPYDTF